MKKFKKKFLLTGLALAVPLVGAIASVCSEVSQDNSLTPPPGRNNSGQGGQNQPGGSGGTSGTTPGGSGGTSGTTPGGSGGTSMMKKNIENILENLPDFF